jgi:plasmid stabilization system protein ParE
VKYRLLVRRRAKADVRAAVRWYELQRTGLGREFVTALDAALNRVAESPLQSQVLHRGVRRAIVHRFPYGIFYRVEGSNIVVFCVSHLHRDSTSWKVRGGRRG